MTDTLLVFSTFPDLEMARQIGTSIIESQLAACVNLCPGTQSLYRWKGNIESSAEVMAIFKTTVQVYPAFEQRLRELHPYEMPEIAALSADQVSAPYAQWVRDETGHTHV